MMDHDFDLWLDEVETLLVQRKEKYRTKDVNQAVLSSAFQGGESPVAFVVAYKHIFPPRTKRRVKRKPGRWLPYGIAAIVVLPVLGVVYRTTLNHMGEEQLNMYRNWGNVRLPIRTKIGPYTPDLAYEAQEEVTKHITEMALVPESLAVHEWEPIRMQGPGTFKFFGTVRAENNYGNVVAAEFSIVASTPIHQVFSDSGTTRTRTSTEWKFREEHFGASGDATVWRERAPTLPKALRKK